MKMESRYGNRQWKQCTVVAEGPQGLARLGTETLPVGGFRIRTAGIGSGVSLAALLTLWTAADGNFHLGVGG